MNETRQWNVAIVGAGNNARVHVEGLLRHPDRVKLSAIVEPDESKRSAFTDRYDVERSFATVQEMLNGGGPQIEVAIVSTPTNVRMDVCRPLFEAGIPVLVEKPMCDNLADALALTAVAAEHNCPLAVNQNFRYHYPYRKARELLQSGALGRPLHLVQYAMYYRNNTGWRAEQSRNLMTVMSVHWLDGFRHLLDDEPETVYCRAVNSPAVEGTSDSAVSLTAVMKQGTLACLNESFSSFHEGGSKNHYCQLDCERGGITMDVSGTLRVAIHGKEPRDIPNAAVDKPESDFLVLNDFLQAIELGAETPTSARDNLKTVRFLEAAYRSAATGDVVRIDDLPLLEGQPIVPAKPGDGEQSLKPSRWGIYHKEPGQAHSKLHFHDCDEWYLVLEGTGTVRVGNAEVDVGPLDLVHAPAGFLHGTLRSEGTYKLVFMESAPRGRGRKGHLHVGEDAPFVEQPIYLPYNRNEAAQ